MLPTFSDGEYLIVDELSYRLHDPKRGDVIIFKYPKDPSKYFIKRIIGLPGEKIAIEGKKIIITNSEHPDGLMLTEPYINNGTESHLSVTLGEGEYFVLGDNRSASSDSRVWGSVPKKLIIGRALIRLTPIREISILPGDYKNF
jgi:signal peptidase I